MANKVSDEASIEIEELQGRIRAGIERAKELVCEAKLMVREQKAAEPSGPSEVAR